MRDRNSSLVVELLDLTVNCTVRRDFIINQLKANSIFCSSWDYSSANEYGIILFNAKEKVPNIRDIMIMQMSHLGRRIIVCFISALENLNADEIFQFYSWGAEYLFNLELIEKYPNSIAEIITRWCKIDNIRLSQSITSRIIGRSLGLKKLLRYCIEAVLFSDAPLLIIGERGTGKELIARLAHELDITKEKCQLVLVDCTTIKPELSGSELFGHEKGAYTGADHSREGAFEIADKGTLFLDEVGELPISQQGELLRVIQEGTYKRLGSNLWRRTNFRLVAATNKDLEQRSTEGYFKKDLLDRISVWKCTMPSLNERKDDIPLLVEYFIKKYTEQANIEIDETVFQYLKEWDYSGNIRELQHIVYRLAKRHSGNHPITIGDIALNDRFKKSNIKKNWYERTELNEILYSAVQEGFDMEQIESMITEKVINITLAVEGSNKNVARKLNKSERWVQLNRAKNC